MNIFLELNNSDREAKNVLYNLSGAIWREEYDLYEIPEDQFKLYPELKQLKQYTLDQARQRADKIRLATEGMQYTDEDQQEMNDRVYLDFVPPKYANWVANPDNGFTYDPIAHQYYTSAQIARLGRYKNRIIDMQRPHYLTGLDINNDKPTLGKSMLAVALNEKDYAKRQMFIARALVQCAKEKALGIEGAVTGYGQIFDAFDNAGLKLGFKENFERADSFISALKEMKSIKNLKDEDLLRQSEIIEKKCLANCYQEAAHNIQNAIEGNVRNLVRVTNQGHDFVIQNVNKLFSDYVHGVAANCNAQICAGTNGDVTFKQYQQFFNQNVDNLIKGLKEKTDLNDQEKLKKFAELSSQIRTMKAMTDKNANVIAVRTDKFVKDENKDLKLEKLQNEFDINNAEAESLLNAFVKNGLSKSRTMGVREFKTNTRVDLPKNAEPLYIVMSYDERKNLSPGLKRVLHTDPYNGALCVADTPENRQKFAQYLPKDEDIQKMVDYAKTLKKDICKYLSEAGVDVQQDQIKIDTERHNIENISYKLTIYENVPKIVIFDKTTNEQKEFELGNESNLKAENFKRDFAKAMNSQSAKEMQKRADVAKNINEMFTSDNMKHIAQTNLDFPYLKHTGISARDFGGYVDNYGAFDGYAFVNNKEATQTKTTIFMPMYNSAGKIINAMAISDNGKEEFIGGAPLKGTFSVPARYMKSNPKAFANSLSQVTAILVVKDPKSAALISKYATENTVVVSANTLDNVKYVAEKLAKQCPQAGIAILSDNNAMEAAQSGVNRSVHEAEHTARVVLRDLRPLARAYTPPLSTSELANGAVTYADAFKVCPEKVKEQITAICIETADNHIIAKSTRDFEQKEAKTLKEYLKRINKNAASLDHEVNGKNQSIEITDTVKNENTVKPAKTKTENKASEKINSQSTSKQESKESKEIKVSGSRRTL